jgi:N-acetyl sugar amidotransferase
MVLKICKKCVMDNEGNSEITFNDQGVCNYCFEYEEKYKKRVFTNNQGTKRLIDILNKIKKSKKKNKYDCVIGVSGGVDSTYVALKVIELGLNPLAVHLDNGWNSELAIHNIQKMLEKLDIDLYTHVIDWNEFKNLQMSFLKCSTPDGEIPTDHAITSILYQIANKLGIKYIISGNNFISEGIMPKMWAYGHIDWKYISSVHSKFGSIPIKTFPYASLSKIFWYIVARRIKLISILNYLNYDKNKAMKEIKEKLDWKYYGGKHYESNYTKFYQGYILPHKFKIDKRKLHLSALILSNQITRTKALKELKKPIYPLEDINRDVEYFRKKLNLSIDDFEKILNDKPKNFFDYPNHYRVIKNLRTVVMYLRTKRLFYN